MLKCRVCCLPLNRSRGVPVYLTLSAILLILPHAIVARLHVHEINIVILTLEMAGTDAFLAYLNLVCRAFHSERCFIIMR